MSESTTYDIIVLGGGPGGYVAAIRAAYLRQKVNYLNGRCRWVKIWKERDGSEIAV
jgi:pyruvate/2-oxoglutarate dehydrogenase complex dihydrolipoamide dehydrogenase (E3) component